MNDTANYDPGPGKISPESGSGMAMSEFVRGPLLPSSVHLDMPDFADIDNVSQAPECVSFGEPGSGKISPESGNVMAMSDFAIDIDAEPGEPFLPSGVHLDMPDFADVNNVLQAPECVSFGEPGSGTVSSGSENVLAMSDFAIDIDAEPVSQAPECVSFDEPGSGTISPESGNAMSDVAGDIDAEPGEPFLPSGVHLDTPDFADIDNVSQAPECVSFGEPGSGTVSPRSGNVLAMSDFVGDIDAEPGEPFLPSGVHLDMPDFADVDNVSQAPECVSFGEPWSGTVSPGSGNVLAKSDFAGDIYAEPVEQAWGDYM